MGEYFLGSSLLRLRPLSYDTSSHWPLGCKQLLQALTGTLKFDQRDAEDALSPAQCQQHHGNHCVLCVPSTKHQLRIVALVSS